MILRFFFIKRDFFLVLNAFYVRIFKPWLKDKIRWSGPRNEEFGVFGPFYHRLSAKISICKIAFDTKKTSIQLWQMIQFDLAYLSNHFSLCSENGKERESISIIDFSLSIDISKWQWLVIGKGQIMRQNNLAKKYFG